MTRDAIKRGLRTALFTFIGAFALTLTGWLADVAEWANDGSDVFPSMEPLVKAAVAAAVAAISGLVSFVVNSFEDGVVHGRALLGATKPEAHI